MQLTNNDDFLLFELFFNLKQLQPDAEEWSEDFLNDNPPRLYRFKMIRSVLNSCNMELKDFISGSFLTESDTELITLIEDKLKESGLRNLLFDSESFDNQLDLIQFMYKHLFKFRFSLQQIYSFNSGVYMASQERMLSINILESVILKVKNETKLIDELLIILFKGVNDIRKIDKLNLICQFDFPMVDLNEIDLEWF